MGTSCRNTLAIVTGTAGGAAGDCASATGGAPRTAAIAAARKARLTDQSTIPVVSVISNTSIFATNLLTNETALLRPIEPQATSSLAQVKVSSINSELSAREKIWLVTGRSRVRRIKNWNAPPL